MSTECKTVLADLADFVAERASVEREAAVQHHLDDCDSCRAQLQFAREFYEAALEQGNRHISTDRLVSYADASRVSPGGVTKFAGELTPLEQEHLENCDSCRGEVEVIRETPSLEDGLKAPSLEDGSISEGSSVPVSSSGRLASSSSTSKPPGDFLRRWRPSLLWGSAAVAAALVLFVWTRPAPDVSGLAQHTPIELQIPRSVPSTEFDRVWLRALDDYVGGDYVASRSGFSEAIRLDDTRPLSWLLLGSSQVLTADPAAAVESFLEVEERIGDPRTRAFQPGDSEMLEEARWQLANAYLSLGEAGEAKRRLEYLAATGQERSVDAGRVLAEWP